MVTAARDESRFRRNETAGMAGERVGQHIAGVHDRHQLADQFLGVGNAPGIVGRPQLTEVDIKRQIGDGGDLLVQADDLQAADQMTRDIRQYTGRGGFGDIVAKPADGHAARPALIDHRRNRRAHTDKIEIEAEFAGDMLINMGMSVDYAGDHQQAAGVNAVERRFISQTGLDHGNLAVADGDIADDLDYVFDLFSILKDRRWQDATTLSGGEQQMCAIGRGIMLRPRLLMIDELSLGLAPRLVERLSDALAEINRNGLTILLVEQDVATAFEIAEAAFVIETGRTTRSGKTTELSTDPKVREAYFGI